VLRQPKAGYRAGGDPIFLAASLSVKPGDTVLDLGAGVGTAGLCLLARCPTTKVEALEIQSELVSLALDNAQANHGFDHFVVHQGDVSNPPDSLVGRCFDWVMTNPPWTEAGTGTAPPTATKAVGHMESEVDLAQWLKAAVGFLRHKGTLVMIHRADRVDDIVAGLVRHKMGGITIRPLYPCLEKAAIRAIISARKGVNTPAEILPGLILHNADGSFTDAAAAILDHGRALV
jgi:tRNA1(Val) A37 N6-methylase TrmN6